MTTRTLGAALRRVARRRAVSALVAALALPCLAVERHADGPDAAATGAFGSRLDRLQRLGDEHPQAALDALSALPPIDDLAARERLLVRGIVLARNGMDGPAAQVSDQLRRLDPAAHGAFGRASAELVQAMLMDTQGRPDRAEAHSRAALDALGSGCAPTAPPRSPSGGSARPGMGTRAGADAGAVEADCGIRLQWQTMMLRQQVAAGRAAGVEARRFASQALDVARRAADAAREALSAAALAVLDADAGQTSAAGAHLAEAWAAARTTGDADVLARLSIYESTIAAAAGNAAAARRATDAGLATARAAGLARLEAVLLVNLADDELQAGRHAQALQAAEQALPTVRLHRDERAERALLHNIGLAKIGLGRADEGRRDVERALAMWERTGAQAAAAAAMREYGNALATQGDHAGALEMFHRERKLAADTMKANRDAALAELQDRFQRSAQEREIDLRARDNAVHAEQLANHQRMRAIWGLLSLAAVLALLLFVLLLRRMRRTQSELRLRQSALREHNERDTLTGLTNRRRFQKQMNDRSAVGRGGLQGALLLVDVDHFKQINDRHGHAGGDAVLVEVARRLATAAGGRALVARWGGEEFLIHSPLDDAAAAQALGARLLHAVGAQPVDLGGVRLRVTVSIGLGRFPLPPHRVPLAWEQALNLVDMALYSAKSQGRNLAIGLHSADAPDPLALHAIEADFELAVQDGRIGVERSAGPAGPAVHLAHAA